MHLLEASCTHQAVNKWTQEEGEGQERLISPPWRMFPWRLFTKVNATPDCTICTFSLLCNEKVSPKPNCSCYWSCTRHTVRDQIKTHMVSVWPWSVCSWSQELCQVYGQDLRCNVQCSPCHLHCSRIMGNARYEPAGRLRAEELNCSSGLDPWDKRRNWGKGPGVLFLLAGHFGMWRFWKIGSPTFIKVTGLKLPLYIIRQ